jgi:hypothetical protein
MQNRKPSAGRRGGFLLFCILNSGFCIISSSCKSPPAATQPSSSTMTPVELSNGQDAAMKDPFGYSPWAKDEKSRISGGGIGEYDKDGMKHDMKSVFDP